MALKTLLDQAGLLPGAKWVMAEGADDAAQDRTTLRMRSYDAVQNRTTRRTIARRCIG